MCNDDDALTTRSVISTISNQGKLDSVNQYKLIRVIGQGSFGKVYLWKDENTGKKRALKKMERKFINAKLIGKHKLYKAFPLKTE